MKLMVEVTKRYSLLFLRSLFLTRAFFVLALILYVNLSLAQFTDSIKVDLKHKPKFSVKIDRRNSVIRNSYARITGYKAEVIFNTRTKIGLSYNVAALSIKQPNDATTKVEYIAPYLEYVFYKKNNWELSVPVMVGFGRSSLINDVQTIRNPIILYEPYMLAEYTLFKYFIIGGGVGYRLGLLNPADYLFNFSAPIYVVKLEFDFALLYKSIFKHSFPEPFIQTKN